MRMTSGFAYLAARLIAILSGAALVSIGLEMFLKPHKIVPGGIKGVAILLSHVTEMKMGLILLYVNLPFVIFKKRGYAKTAAALATLLAITSLTLFLHPFPPFIENPVLASICGGLIFGTGVGLIVRNGSYADGVNDVAFFLKKKIKWSIGELVMIINLTILVLGGFLFGWDQAIHSVVAYFLAYKAIQFTLDFGKHKLIWIRTDKRAEIKQRLVQEFSSDIQFLIPPSGSPDRGPGELYFTLPDKNVKKLKSFIRHIDDSANIVVSTAGRSNSESYYRL